MIILRLLELYIWLALSVFIHEGFHFAAAVMFRIKVINCKIGDSLFAIKIGKVSISPIAVYGYTDVEKAGLYGAKKSRIILFFLSGTVGNCMLVFVMLLFFPGYQLKLYIVGLNLYMIVLSLLPLYKRSDMRRAITCLKEYRYKNH